MFYDKYILFCEKIGKKPYTAARELGLGKSNVAQWKKGSTPRPALLKKMAEYFDVPVTQLLDYATDEEPAAAALSQQDKSMRQLSAALSQLNDEGVEKLLDIADDLVRSGKYIKSRPAGLGKRA